MNIILDTHAAIWFIADDDNLPLWSKDMILDPQNICYVSIASLWELGIKFSLGKLELKADLTKIFDIFFESGLSLLPVTPEHILTNTRLDFHHRDPFDRVIIAQAAYEGFSIVTRDKEFRKYSVNLVWNKPKK